MSDWAPPRKLTAADPKCAPGYVMKSLVDHNPRFEEFFAEAGRTWSAIQQTELAHVTPPRFKPKSRFMNLQASLRWACVISWLLADPDTKSLKALSTDRVETKLGWLREYAEDLAAWQKCQTVIDLSCVFLNEHGVFPGVTACLQSLICESVSHSVSRALADRLLTFVLEAEAPLCAGERLPISTKILESRFGLYKQLEGQHSKGGCHEFAASDGRAGASGHARACESRVCASEKQGRESVGETAVGADGHGPPPIRQCGIQNRNKPKDSNLGHSTDQSEA